MEIGLVVVEVAEFGGVHLDALRFRKHSPSGTPPRMVLSVRVTSREAPETKEMLCDLVHNTRYVLT